ncbi:AI-2E family transporter [Desulfonema ishimotonii]|uniref:AI-2E family transporter n=1 Tax=Desulfonema ishimotonii TaxID=45657 RepID=A0A401FS52_9BACT|nr:AI-2E family transporter [Desulfonema ishimotonii]GBC59799.1 AI-2E family transporter [Desulfonema ishimotonii]
MTDLKLSDPLLRKIIYSVGIMGVIAFGFYTFSLFKGGLGLLLDVLTPFIAAFLLAYILAPVVIMLQRHLRLGRFMGTLALYMIIFIAVFLLLAFLIPTVLTEFIRLFNAMKTGIPPLLNKLSQSSYLNVDAELITVLQDKIREIHVDYEKIISTILPSLRKVASGGLQAVELATRGLFTGVGSVVSFFSFIIFVGIINFYFIVDWENISPVIRKMVPPERRDRAFDILEKVDTAVGGFLRGQLTVSAIVGSLFAVGLFGMGFIGFPALRNYCILIGTAAAIGGFIPYLGAVMGVTPAIIIILMTTGVAWSVKLISLGSVLVLFSAIQAIEGFVLQPKIVGKGAGLHPLAVMFALLFGAQFGIGGMIIAVPAASIIRVLFREFYWLPIERREAALITQEPAED